MITIPEILLHHNLQFFRQAVLAISSILSTGGQWGQLRGLLNRKEHKRLQQVHLLSASFCSWLYPLIVEVQIQITLASNCNSIKNHVFCPHQGGGETMDRCREKEIGNRWGAPALRSHHWLQNPANQSVQVGDDEVLEVQGSSQVSGRLCSRHGSQPLGWQFCQDQCYLSQGIYWR